MSALPQSLVYNRHQINICKGNTDINQHYALFKDKIAGKNKNKRKKSKQRNYKRKENIVSKHQENM